MPYTPIIERHAVTLENMATTTSSADLGGATLVAVELPTVTMATFTLETLLADGTTWAEVTKDTGTAYSVTATDGKFVVLDKTYTLGVRIVRLKGNTAETGGSTLTIQLITRPVY